jgi:hypothetical protein
MKAPCFSVSELLEKYFDQEVTDEERSLVEGHLQGCPSCQDVLKSLNEVRNLIKAPVEEALRKEQFEWLWQRIKEEVQQEERLTWWESIRSWFNPFRFFQKKVWIPAAVAILILITAHLISPTKVDLAITSVSGPSNANVGQQIPVTTTVKNLGGRTGGFYVTVYISTDPTITSRDIPIGSINLSAFTAGAQQTLTIKRALIPCTVTAGVYYIGAIVDSKNSVAELNENNNSLAGNQIFISGDCFT